MQYLSDVNQDIKKSLSTCDFYTDDCAFFLSVPGYTRGATYNYGKRSCVFNGKCKFEHPDFNPVCNDLSFVCVTDTQTKVTMPMSSGDIWSTMTTSTA